MFNTKNYMFFLIGIILSISLFAQDSLFAQQNNRQKMYLGNSREQVIQYGGFIYDKLDVNLKKSINKPKYNPGSLRLNKYTTPLNDTVDTFNCYIDFINRRMQTLIECQEIYVSIQNDKIKNKYEDWCMGKILLNIFNKKELIKYVDSNVIPFKRLDKTSKPNDIRAKEYADHMNRIFNQLAQIFSIEDTGYNSFLNTLNKRLNAIDANRYVIFQWYRDWYCNKQYISNNFQLVFFINDVSNLDSNTSYPQGSVFLINDLYKRDNASARERRQFFIKNQKSQANTQQSSVARKVYDFMDDEWGVSFTYHDNYTTDSQSDCDYRPWLVIGSFLQFVSVNRYECKELLEFFPGQPGDFGFDWDCLRNDYLYPERLNSFLEKWINDKFAYVCKSQTGNLTGAAKTEALLGILKEQLNIVKPRLRYIKNHTTDANAAEFIRHIINED